ncbi:hypothetical protein [Protofrankia symbiont of Coriaria ruscifolia]|uniref:hypothetical protein n=1 Tax=Protofrankia symbiont of Coriaria ruscifolia TaxID=1306542 RepID=UPI0010419DB1|nr:hypothetical protein [Protofrankia symbiont of Coriaria ruscifolia]
MSATNPGPRPDADQPAGDRWAWPWRNATCTDCLHPAAAHHADGCTADKGTCPCRAGSAA